MGQYSSQATTHLISNWKQLDKQPQILVNLVTNDHIHRHRTFVKSQEQIKVYVSRMKEHYSYICKVIYFHPETVQETPNQQNNCFPRYFYVYTDRIIPVKHWNLQLAQMIMKGFRKLFATYGAFRVQSGMLGQNQKGEAKVWINTNPTQNHPIAAANSQQQMLADLAGILMQSQKNIAGLLIGCKTFSQALRNLVQAHRNQIKQLSHNNHESEFKELSGKINYQHYSHRGDKCFQREKDHQRILKLQSKKQVISKNSSNPNEYISSRFAEKNILIDPWTIRKPQFREYISQGKQYKNTTGYGNKFPQKDQDGSQQTKNQAVSVEKQIPNARNFIANFYNPTSNLNIAKQQRIGENQRDGRTVFSPEHFANIVDSSQRHLSFNPVRKYENRGQKQSMERPNSNYRSQEKGKQFESFQHYQPYIDYQADVSSQNKRQPQKSPQYTHQYTHNRSQKNSQNQSLKSSTDITGRLKYQNKINKIPQKTYHYHGNADYKSPQGNRLQHSKISEDIYQQQCQSPLLKKQSQSKFNGGTPQFLKYRAPKSQARNQQSEVFVLSHQKQKSKEENRTQTLNDIQIAMKFHEASYQIRNKTQDFDRSKNVPSFIPKKRQQMLGDNLSNNVRAESIDQQRGDKLDINDIGEGQQIKKVKKSNVNIINKLNNSNAGLSAKIEFKSQKGYSNQQNERQSRQKRALADQHKKQQIQYYEKQMYRKKRQENNRKFIETMEDYGMYGYKKQNLRSYKRAIDKQPQQNNQLLAQEIQFFNHYAHYHQKPQVKNESKTSNYTQSKMERSEGYNKTNSKTVVNIVSKSDYHQSYEHSQENSLETNSEISDRQFEQDSKRKYKQEMARQLKMEFGSILSWGGVEEEKVIKTAEKSQHQKMSIFKSPPKDCFNSQRAPRQTQKLRKQSIQSLNKNEQYCHVKERESSVASNQEVQRREKIQSIISKYADNVKDDMIKQKVERKKATFAELKKEAMKILSDDLF